MFIAIQLSPFICTLILPPTAHQPRQSYSRVARRVPPRYHHVTPPRPFASCLLRARGSVDSTTRTKRGNPSRAPRRQSSKNERASSLAPRHRRHPSQNLVTRQDFLTPYFGDVLSFPHRARSSRCHMTTETTCESTLSRDRAQSPPGGV